MKDFDNFKDSFTDLKNVLSKLNEIINFEMDNKEIKRDSTIQRFEFCYELIWKNLKRILEIEGFNPKSPRETFEFAYKNDIFLHIQLHIKRDVYKILKSVVLLKKQSKKRLNIFFTFLII